MKFFSPRETAVAEAPKPTQQERLERIDAEIQDIDARMAIIARKIRSQGNVITPDDSAAMSAERIRWNNLLAERAALLS